MESQKFRPTRVKIVAILDIVLTLLLVVDIFCFTVYPIWALHYGETRVVSELEPPPESRHKRPPTPKISGTVLWSLVGAVVLFGCIAILAAAALLKSTKENVDPGEALQIVQFWMHCNLLTLFTTAIGFLSMLFLWIDKYQIRIPIPTLCYFGIRLIFTLVIFLELRALKRPTLDSSMFTPIPAEETDPARLQRYGVIGSYYLPRPSMEPPTLVLGPYKGTNLSVPSTQCLTPQTVDDEK